MIYVLVAVLVLAGIGIVALVLRYKSPLPPPNPPPQPPPEPPQPPPEPPQPPPEPPQPPPEPPQPPPEPPQPPPEPPQPPPEPPQPPPEPPQPPPEPLPCRSRPSLQIIDGKPSEPGKWPWQVGVISNQLCGGSLIAPSWVLTAAHCLPPDFAPEKINIYLGTIALRGNDPNKQIIPAKQVFLHPTWNEEEVLDDIALIKLSRPVTYNQYISPICLASKQYNFGGKTLVTTGWGRTVSNVPGGSDTLNETTTFAGPDACVNWEVPDTQICTFNPRGGASGKATGTCKGDSGGPLVLQDGDTWVLVGITSFGGDVCAEEPTFYTNVYSYLDWILETINANP